MGTNELQKLSRLKVKLNPPLIASFLLQGQKHSDIAKACNVSQSAVKQYTDKHMEEILPLINDQDTYIALQSKHIANQAQGRLLIHLKETEKKDLFALNAISGTHIDKYRLLSDKSTQNVSMDVNNSNIDEITKAIHASEKRLKALTGSVEVGNDEVIDR